MITTQNYLERWSRLGLLRLRKSGVRGSRLKNSRDSEGFDIEQLLGAFAKVCAPGQRKTWIQELVVVELSFERLSAWARNRSPREDDLLVIFEFN